MEMSLDKSINLTHRTIRLTNQREMGHLAKEYLGLQKVESVLAETADLSMTKESLPDFASIAESSLLTLEFVDIGWDTSNSRVQ